MSTLEERKNQYTRQLVLPSTAPPYASPQPSVRTGQKDLKLPKRFLDRLLMTLEWESRKNLETSVALFLFEAFIVSAPGHNKVLCLRLMRSFGVFFVQGLH